MDDERDQSPPDTLEETEDGVYLTMDIDLNELQAFKGKVVNAERLGITKLSGFSFENQNGTPFLSDTDYFGKSRSLQSPVIGPIEVHTTGKRIKVWTQEN